MRRLASAIPAAVSALPSPRPFRAPAWARHFTRESLPFRLPDLQDDRENFWYLELGGLQDTIRDTESIRDELLKAAYGLWDYIKNAPENREKNRNFDLDFIGIFPGKRESRRYIGDHVLTQTDVEHGGVFPDVVAYGGWSMDDHDPAWERELDRPMSHNIRLGRPASHVPKTLVRSFTLTLIDENGQTETLTVSDHHQRLYRLPVGKRLKKVRFTPHTTHGSETVHIFAFDVR